MLTADRVKLFQPTSGSSSATKLIPWTATLGREFRRGISPWLAALYRRKPALLGGTAYWSISPPARRFGDKADCQWALTMMPNIWASSEDICFRSSALRRPELAHCQRHARIQNENAGFVAGR